MFWSRSYSTVCTYFAYLFPSSFVFFFSHTATTELYTLSLHDALPISMLGETLSVRAAAEKPPVSTTFTKVAMLVIRSEEHTSELQSLRHLVCRLLLEKKKKKHRDKTEENK